MSNKHIGAVDGTQLVGNGPLEHQAIDAIYKWIDKTTHKVAESYPWWPCLIENKDQPDVCVGGCCSHSLFMISQIEAHEVIGAFLKMPKEQQEFVLRRAANIYNDYFVERLEKGMSLNDICLEAATSIATCPLLDLKTRKCTIYKSRPMTCRTFGMYYDSKHSMGYFSETVAKVVEKREKDGEKVTLPDYNAVREEFGKLLDECGGTTAPIIVYLLMAGKLLS